MTSHFVVRLTDDDTGLWSVWRFEQNPFGGDFSVRCLREGCTWTHPEWDEQVMEAHARAEWGEEDEALRHSVLDVAAQHEPAPDSRSTNGKDT